MMGTVFSKVQKALLLIQFWQAAEEEAKADDGRVSMDELFEIAIATGIRFAEMLLPTLTEIQQQQLQQIRVIVSSKKAVYDEAREKLAQALDKAESVYEDVAARFS